MLNYGFGRWLGDPYPYPEYKYQSQLNGLDWLWWHSGNDIDMGDCMDDYVYTAPVPPYPYTLAISPEAYNVTNARGCFYLKITSNYDWSITCADAWLTCEPTSGTGNATIIFRHAPNTGAQRTSSATITCDALTETLTVVQDVTAVNDDAYTNTRHVLIIYAVHEDSLEDPLAPSEYNDTAIANYNNAFRQLGLSEAEWAADGYSLSELNNRPPLAVIAKLAHGDYYPFDITHVGLADGAITPYIVPKVGSIDPTLAGRAEHPNGYYVKQTPLIGGLPTNTDGWTTWAEGRDRQQALAREILNSDYLATYLDPDLKYDKNETGDFDFIIVANPQLYKWGYYTDNEFGTADRLFLSPPVTILGTQYSRAKWQPYSLNDAYVMWHEHTHIAYYSTCISNELLAAKEWAGDPLAVTVTQFVGDLYRTEQPYPPPPWYRFPCAFANVQAIANVGCIGIPHPLISASLGFTTLNRWAKADGNYTIDNVLETMDYLCLQSPYDQEQYMVLCAYYPPLIDGSTDYPYSGLKHPTTGAEINKHGVYATVIKFRDDQTPPYNYEQKGGFVQSYMVDTMTEYYGFGNIDTADTRIIANTSQEVVNAKAVLLDHDNPTWNPSGLSNENAKFGVLVEWVGWSVVDGVNTATVTITFDTP